MIDTERLDLPSASKFDILVNCPGQPAMVKSLGDQIKEDEPDEEALSGTRVHRARETGDTSQLDETEVVKYEAGMKYEQQIVTQWCNSNGITEYREGPREFRGWINDPVTLEPMSSGQLDVHYIALPFLLVIDWKTFFCWNLPASNVNWQLRKQAVLAMREYENVDQVWVAFVKPGVMGKEKIDITVYTRSDLEMAERDIFYHLWRPKQPGAQRVPGAHCRYCPAKSDCPEAGAYSILPSVLVNEISPKDMITAVDRMAPEDLAVIVSRISIINAILERVKKRMKGLPAEELARLGWKLGNGKNLDPIVNTKGAFDALVSFGIPEEVLWASLGFGKGDLVDNIRIMQGWKKANTESWLWNQILLPFIEKKKSEGSLEKLP